jgi:hypothetical protein
MTTTNSFHNLIAFSQFVFVPKFSQNFLTNFLTKFPTPFCIHEMSFLLPRIFGNE